MGTQRVTMTLGQFLDELRRLGHEVTPSQVRYALEIGRIDKPEKDGADNYLYGPRHVTQACFWFSRNRRKKPNMSRFAEKEES